MNRTELLTLVGAFVVSPPFKPMSGAQPALAAIVEASRPPVTAEDFFREALGPEFSPLVAFSIHPPIERNGIDLVLTAECAKNHLRVVQSIDMFNDPEIVLRATREAAVRMGEEMKHWMTLVR